MTDPTPETTPTRDEAVLYARYDPTWERMMPCQRTDFGAREYRLASGGGVDAVARRAKYLLNRLETDDGLGIGEIDTMLRMAASLSPAATPVSEAGGEAAERSWRRTKFEFIGAMRQALINSGLTREQVIIADNAITEAFSDLAKPASSPAGGDVREASLSRSDVCRLWQYAAIERPSMTVEGFTNLLLNEIDDRAEALSQPIFAGRVGE